MIYKLLNWSQISRHVTGKRQNLVFPHKVPRMYWDKIDELIYKQLPEWWEQFKNSKTN